MKWLRNLLRSGAVALALVGASVTTKPAQADGGAVVAGIAGGLILGTIIGSTANAQPYYSGGYYSQPYYAPPVYSAPVYAPPVISYSYNYVNPGRYYRPYRGYSGRHYRRSHYGHKRHYHGGRHHYRGHGRHHGGHGGRGHGRH